MGAITRHWSTVLNGTEIDLAAFKKEIDAVVKHAQKTAGKTEQRAGWSMRPLWPPPFHS